MAAGLVIPGGGFLYKKAIDQNTIFAPKSKRKTNMMAKSNDDRQQEIMPKIVEPVIVGHIGKVPLNDLAHNAIAFNSVASHVTSVPAEQST